MRGPAATANGPAGQPLWGRSWLVTCWAGRGRAATLTRLATLLELNQSQIDEYHRIATDQADRSFRSSQRAMGLGLLVIVGCFAASLYFGNDQTKVFVAAIAGVAAALSAFLNRTYLQMYGQTLSQLNRYFEQPVLTGYYLLTFSD